MKNRVVRMTDVKFRPKPKTFNFTDLEGRRFGKLKGIGYLGRATFESSLWLFHCDCGNYVRFSTREVVKKGVAHCGCESDES